MKNIALLSCLFLAFFLGACSENEEVDSSIELACPRLEQTQKGNVLTITWNAVAKTEGYAYKLDNADYTRVGADVTSFTATLTHGDHLFSIYAIGNNAHTTDSAVRTLEINFDATLAMPSLTVGTDGTEATFEWEAVPAAEGYAYKYDDQAEFTKVGSDVLSYTATFSPGTHKFYIYAVGDNTYSIDSPVREAEFDIVDTSTGYFVKKTTGKIVRLEEVATGIYGAEVECTKSDDFVILIDGAEYGFTAYSGNGGVGHVNSLFAAVPFYNKVNYYVRESLGQLTSTPADALNKLYVNTDEECVVEVRVDMTSSAGTPPRYYLKIKEKEDPSIVLAQYFDLMVYGGDWPNYIKGTANGATVGADFDGTAPGEKGTAAATGYGAVLVSSADAGVGAYMANRGLEGWTAAYIYEFASCIRMGHSSSAAKGVLTTPKLSSLGGATTLTVTFDGLRFASKENIAVKVLNAGRITSVQVNADGAAAATPINVEADNTSFLITPAYGTNYANADKKSWSNFTFVVEGATAETQISWDGTGVTAAKEGRYMLDNIVIKK